MYTLGDSRDIHFKKRHIKKNKKRSIWIEEKKHFHRLTLCNESVFVLHPLDEKPMRRHSEDTISQIMHGNIRVRLHQLSIAFVFRVVTQDCLYYDNLTDIKYMDEDLGQRMKKSSKLFDDIISEFDSVKKDTTSKYQQLALKKMEEWGWL